MTLMKRITERKTSTTNKQTNKMMKTSDGNKMNNDGFSERKKKLEQE